MSFADQLARLRRAVVIGESPERGDFVRVDRFDLRELLFHFDRIDRELRTIHAEREP